MIRLFYFVGLLFEIFLLPHVYAAGRTEQLRAVKQSPQTSKAIPVAAGVLAKKGRFVQNMRLKDQLQVLSSELSSALEKSIISPMMNIKGAVGIILREHLGAPFYVIDTLEIVKKLSVLYEKIHQQGSSYYYKPYEVIYYKPYEVIADIELLKKRLKELSNEYFVKQKRLSILPPKSLAVSEPKLVSRMLASQVLQEINIKTQDVLTALHEELFYSLSRTDLEELSSLLTKTINYTKIQEIINTISSRLNLLPRTAQPLIKEIIDIVVNSQPQLGYIVRVYERIKPDIKNIDLRNMVEGLLTTIYNLHEQKKR